MCERDPPRLLRDDARARPRRRCALRRRSRARRTAARAAVVAPTRRRAAPRAPRPRPRTGRRPRSGRRARSRARRRRRAVPRCSSPRSTSPAPRPVPIERNTKSSTPRATPRHCSPSAARLMSFSSVTGSRERVARARGRTSRPRARHVRRERDALAVRLDDARHADDDAVDAAPASPVGRDERARAGATIDVDRRPRVGAAQTRRPDARGSRRAGRRSRRAGSARRGRGRARAPPPGPARRRRRRSSAAPGCAAVSRTRPASSSDCSASETVGFEMPTRREISAREIGAPLADRLEHGALVEILEQRRRSPRRRIS